MNTSSSTLTAVKKTVPCSYVSRRARQRSSTVPSISFTGVRSTRRNEKRQMGDPKKWQVGQKSAAHFNVHSSEHFGNSQLPNFPPDRGECQLNTKVRCTVGG